MKKHDPAGEPDLHSIERIERRLTRLEELMERLTGQKSETHIRIENLHIQHAVLESMEVKLDSLDVEEVSGSLNIGNNFHTLKNDSGKKSEAVSGKSQTMPADEPRAKTGPSPGNQVDSGEAIEGSGKEVRSGGMQLKAGKSDGEPRNTDGVDENRKKTGQSKRLIPEQSDGLRPNAGGNEPGVHRTRSGFTYRFR